MIVIELKKEIKLSFIFNNTKTPYKKVYFGINGQFGDIVMQIPALEQFIKDNPDTKIVFGMADKYKDILPLFYDYHENIIEYKAWEGYNDWPTISDLEYINSQNFDAMFPFKIPTHDTPDWPKDRHICAETAKIMGLDVKLPDNDIRLPPLKDLVREPKTVSLHLFSSKWPGGIRSIDIPKQNFIVNFLRKQGYKIYQLSGPDQPHIKNTIFFKGTYFESCKKMLSTDFFVTCDSGMPWIASAYNHHTIALHSSGYNLQARASGEVTTKSWTPVNPNSVILESYRATDIAVSDILKEIKNKIEVTS